MRDTAYTKKFVKIIKKVIDALIFYSGPVQSVCNVDDEEHPSTLRMPLRVTSPCLR